MARPAADRERADGRGDQGPASRWVGVLNDDRHLAPAPAPRARCVAAPARGRAHRPVPAARLGRGDAARGDAAVPRRRRSAAARSATTASRTSSAGRSPRRRTWPARSASPPPVTLQPQYSLLVREIESEIVPACLDAGMGLLPWSPLAGGWLTGKYQRDSTPTGATRLGEDPERGMEAWEPRNARGAHLARSSTPSPRSPRRAASTPHRCRSPGWRAGRRSPR